jgi:hypothetical protein
MNYYQTDSFFNDDIHKYGCLFFSLMDIAESYTGHSFIPKTINKLYDSLVDKSLMRPDCYVLNHEKVLQDALEVFTCHDKVTYAGAWYNDKQSYSVSWGERNGMYMIMQMRTKNGNGHFRRMHYDPYKPLIQFTNLQSVRYYDIGV